MKSLKKALIPLFLSLAFLFVLSSAALAADTQAKAAANALYSLGLFKGTGVADYGGPIFELDRAPTRAEGITMLVRLLKEEEKAVNGSWETPFTDLADWAAPYVGYAYANGLTFGISDELFGSQLPLSATQYLTLLLRALGYESGADFQWDAAWELTDALGITEGQYGPDSAFLRGDVAFVSYRALFVCGKGSETTLHEALGFGAPPAGNALTVDEAQYAQLTSNRQTTAHFSAGIKGGMPLSFGQELLDESYALRCDEQLGSIAWEPGYFNPILDARTAIPGAEGLIYAEKDGVTYALRVLIDYPTFGLYTVPRLSAEDYIVPGASQGVTLRYPELGRTYYLVLGSEGYRFLYAGSSSDSVKVALSSDNILTISLAEDFTGSETVQILYEAKWEDNPTYQYGDLLHFTDET